MMKKKNKIYNMYSNKKQTKKIIIHNLSVNIKNTTDGITLITLVITIIALVVLAGISIATLTGNNGILNQATKAKIETENSTFLEELKIVVLGSYNNKGELELNKLNENLKKLSDIKDIDNSKFPLTVTFSRGEYLISKQGEIIDSNIIKYNKNGLAVYLDANNNTHLGHNNKTNIWNDLSGNAHNAILKNFEYNELSGWTENSLKLKGNELDNITSNEEVIIPYSLKENQNFSFEIVFEDNSSQRNTYMSADTEWYTFRFHDYYNKEGIYDGRFYIGGNNQWDATNTNRFIPTDTNYFLKENKRYYIGYTYNGENMEAKLYINGTNQIFSKIYNSKPQECKNFKIKTIDGEILTGATTYYQIRFYNRVLSDEEIEQNFNIDNEKYQIKKQ